MLKFRLNKEAHAALDDTLKAFYALDGEDFVLQTDGGTDKSKLDEFRQSNVELLKQAEKTKGVDLDKYNTMLDTERKIREGELIKSGDIETLVNERIANMETDYKGKLQVATDNANNATNQYHSLMSKTEIEGAAFKAFGSNKIRPEAHDAVMAQIKNTFSVQDGVVIGKQGETVLAGANGNLTINEFVNSQPDFMRVPNSPGGASGGDNAPMAPGRSSQDKIQSGLESLMNK